jgi:flagellin-like hook-associated protein FlgL
MDLSAVAGSPALIALQTLASSAADPGAGSSKVADAAAAAQPAEQASVGATASLYAVSQGVGQALSVADAASSAGQTVLGLLNQMQQAAGQAGDSGLSTADRQSLDQAFQASAAAIAPALQSASVGGVNLVDGSLNGSLKVALGDGAQASLSALDLQPDGATLALGGASLATADDATAAQGRVASAIQSASGAVEGLQAQAGALAGHASLVQSLGQAAAAPSTDGEDGARLLALQVSQQLSAQTGAIANAAPQQILALFRS